MKLPAGGNLRGGNPADEVPRVAALRLLPAAGVGLPAPDGGHAGGEALCHRGGGGPGDGHLRQQHRTLPTTVQQDGGVSARQHTRKAHVTPSVLLYRRSFYMLTRRLH